MTRVDSFQREIAKQLDRSLFRRESHKEVAQALGVTEDTAKKRVSRALEKLRAFFARRGVTLSVTALAASLAANSAAAKPPPPDCPLP